MSTFKKVNAMEFTYKSHIFIDSVKWEQDTDGWEVNGVNTLLKSQSSLSPAVYVETQKTPWIRNEIQNRHYIYWRFELGSEHGHT